MNNIPRNTSLSGKQYVQSFNRAFSEARDSLSQSDVFRRKFVYLAPEGFKAMTRAEAEMNFKSNKGSITKVTLEMIKDIYEKLAAIQDIKNVSKEIQEFAPRITDSSDLFSTIQAQTAFDRVLSIMVSDATVEIAKRKKAEESRHLLAQGLETLPENVEDLPEGFVNIPLEEIEEAKSTHIETAQPLENVKEGKQHFGGVLNELNRLKNRLGGSPTFGRSLPTINEDDNQKKFLGVPLSAVRDWLAMVLKKGWVPKIFWEAVAKLFNVTPDNQKSQYEEAHLHIQRFGMLIANKERLIEIIRNQDASRFSEFNTITGLAWHPKSNGPGTEIMYIEFIENFLTAHFEEAKKKGDDALVEYFEAFSGVCFEDRARILEEYALKHPIGELAGVTASIGNVLDIDTNRPFDERGGAFDVIFNHLGINDVGGELTPLVFLEELKNNNIFDTEFPKDGLKVKPTLEDYHIYALKMINSEAMDPYTEDEFLNIELEIFRNSGKDFTESNFREQLKNRDGSNGGEFKADSPEVEGFIKSNFNQ